MKKFMLTLILGCMLVGVAVAGCGTDPMPLCRGPKGVCNPPSVTLNITDISTRAEVVMPVSPVVAPVPADLNTQEENIAIYAMNKLMPKYEFQAPPFHIQCGPPNPDGCRLCAGPDGPVYVCGN